MLSLQKSIFRKHCIATRLKKNLNKSQDSVESIKAIDKIIIMKTIQGLKLDKALGLDNITNKALKTAHAILTT